MTNRDQALADVLAAVAKADEDFNAWTRATLVPIKRRLRERGNIRPEMADGVERQWFIETQGPFRLDAAAGKNRKKDAISLSQIRLSRRTFDTPQAPASDQALSLIAPSIITSGGHVRTVLRPVAAITYVALHDWFLLSDATSVQALIRAVTPLASVPTHMFERIATDRGFWVAVPKRIVMRADRSTLWMRLVTSYAPKLSWLEEEVPNGDGLTTLSPNILR